MRKVSKSTHKKQFFIFFFNNAKALLTDKYVLILSSFIILYLIYFTTASFLRYENYYAGRFDLGNMDQTVWNTFRGRIFQTSSDDADGISIISRLSAHADFILILISPLYYIWTDPRMLLLLQTIIIGLGAVFVYLLGIKILKDKLLSLLYAIGYLLNPSVNYVNLYDFHAVALATTFLLGAFYFLYTKKYLWFVLFSLFAALTKEQVWIIVSFFGVYLIAYDQANRFKKNKKFSLTKPTVLGFFITLLCASIFYYLIWHAIPHVRGGNHFALEYYKDFGDEPTSIVKKVIFSPLKLFSIIFQGLRLEYLGKLFAPVGFVSLLAPLYLLFSTADLLLNLLSSNTQLSQIYYQYTATISPFIYISAIFGIVYIKKKIPHKVIAGFLAICIVVSAFFFGPLPFALHPSVDMFTKQPYDKELIDSFISKIPKRYAISSTNNIGAHLSHRRQIFTVPVGMERADYVIFLLNDISAQPSLPKQWEMVETLKKNTNYKLIIEKNDFIVFKKAPFI